MNIQNIIVVKETREGEARVALTPADVSLFSSRFHVFVELGAGSQSGFQDAEYVRTGAIIFDLASKTFPENSIILRVKLPSQEREALELNLYHKTVVMMGFLDPLDPVGSFDRITTWQKVGLSAYSMDLFKSLLPHDNKNMLSAMSRIAGKLALKDALTRYRGSLPPKVVVLGAGPAGRSAAQEASKAGLPVKIFGRSDRFEEWADTPNVMYYKMPEKNHVEYLRHFLSDATLIVAASRVAGERASQLIDKESLLLLPKGAIVVDLTVNEGGSVALAKSDSVVEHEGITIVHVSGYPKQVPQEASMAYSHCMTNLLNEVLSSEGVFQYDHALLKESWVTFKGSRNPIYDYSPRYFET